MKKTLTLVFLGITTFCFGQNELVEYYQKASKFLEKEDVTRHTRFLALLNPSAR